MINLALYIVVGTVITGGFYVLMRNRLGGLLGSEVDDDIEWDGDQKTRIRHGGNM